MEGNRDEADRCIEIAKTALRAGKPDRAEKFLRKADALYPTQAAKDLLTAVLSHQRSSSAGRNAADGAAAADDAATTPSAADASGSKRRQSPARGPVQPEYTTVQLQLVQKIKK